MDRIRVFHLRKVVGVVFLVCLALIISGAWWLQQELFSEDANGEQIIVEIARGSSAAEIGQLLETEGIIRNGNLFQYYAVISGANAHLTAGAYELRRGSSIAAVTAQIAAGKVLRDRYVFSIPEGSNIRQIAVAAERQGFCSEKEFLEAVERSTLRAKAPGVVYALEGYLYPATYRFDTLPTPEQLIDEFYSYGQLYYNDLEIPEDFPLTLDEVIVLASVLEKESQYDGERERVAGVFLNRLEDEMPLQSCATVQYVLPEFKEILSEADTQIESPYNTYVYDGLPVGPISNPSLMAMRAVLHPEKNDYFYFVADPKGKHIFSRTYEEHLAAIATLEE